jgi:prepilin-type N-terminal cleavage/methylation domain-containing protein
MAHAPHLTSRFFRARARAFTLIEVIVVLIIISIVSAAAISSMGKTRQNRQRSAARTLGVNIAYARERALATGHATWVYVYTNTETISLYETIAASVVPITDPATNTQLTTVLGSSSDNAQFAEVGVLAVNGSTSASPIIFGFDWQGRPTDSGGVLLTSDWTITISQAGQTTITLTVYAETGFAAVTAW